MSNDITTQIKTQDKKDPYNEFLDKRISNYTDVQMEFYDRIKDLPSFKIFLKKVCEYVYNSSNKQYYHIITKNAVDFKAYESALYGYYLSLYKHLSRDIKNEYKDFLKFKSLLKVLNLTIPMNGLTFNPIIKDNVIFEDDALLLNEYKNKSITKDRIATTEDEEQAIQDVLFHIKELIGDDYILNNKGEMTKKKNFEFFIDWIAHQVQNPGTLLRFAPIIQGIQGSGKTFIRKLLQNIISKKYVKPISNEDLKSSFNFYVTNRLVNVVEELKIDGKKDSYVVTKLKEFVANDEFTINRKNISQYTVQNTTNYLMLTNDKNCIPLETNERRYWIIYSPITKKDLTEIYPENYFYNLHTIIVKHKEILRNYFLNHKISQEFKNCNIAPKTQASKELIEITKSNIIGYNEAKLLLSIPSSSYNKNCIVSKVFFKELEKKGVKGLNNRNKSKLLHVLGYTKFHKSVRISYLNKRDVYTIYIYDNLYNHNMDNIDVIGFFEEKFYQDEIEAP